MAQGKSGVFLKEGIIDFRSIGTVCSTSAFVAKAMAPKIHANDPPRVIVELGVGTGSITKEIMRHLRPQDFFLGIEQNEKLLAICRETIAKGDAKNEVHLEHGFAQNIKTILERHHVGAADDIVCTIPFRVLPRHETIRILEEAGSVLKPGGHFVFVRYVLAPENKLVFDTLKNFHIVRKKLVMRNIPPAEVITLKKA